VGPGLEEREMAEQASRVQEGVDRISDAVHSIDHEFQRVQKQLDTRRKSIEKQIASTRKKVEKRTRSELNRFQSEIQKYPLVKRAESLRNEASKQIESTLGSLLKMMQIPSKSDLARIERRLSALSRRVKEIEKTRKKNGASPA
jgi:DNA anti-recombination protein RmuC